MGYHGRSTTKGVSMLKFLGQFFTGELAARWIMALLGLLVLVLAVWWGWAKVEDRGYQRAKAEYEQRIEVYRKTIQALDEREHRQRQELTEDRTKIVAELGLQLSAATSRAQAAEARLKRKTAYVTPKADSLCVVPAGAVELLREAAGANPTPGSPTLAESRPDDADRASGVALSELAGVIAQDLSECVIRGEVITAWQTWYRQNEQVWEDYRKSFQEPPKLE